MVLRIEISVKSVYSITMINVKATLTINKRRQARACDQAALVSSMAFLNHCPPGPEHDDEYDDDKGDDEGDDDDKDDDDDLDDEDCSSSLAR